MTKTIKRIAAIFMAVLLAAAVFAACNGEETEETEEIVAATAAAGTTTTVAATQAADQNTDPTLAQGDEVVTTANVTTNGVIDAGELFSDRDLRQTADLSEAVYHTLADNKDITLSTAGVYVITGSASDASIIVDAGDDDKVQIVLNNVTVNNASIPAIYVKNADKVFVTTVSGTQNTLSVSGSFTADGDTNTDAVIFSKDDLVLNGLGTLTVSSTDNGISCKDDLKITGGTITITAAADAIEANDSIAVADGTINITTDKDGLHAENDEDNTVGYIYICGGSFNITAGSDGIQATTVTQIDGGTINVSGCREGIEATYVQINGGTISISASDDGINGSSKSGAYTPTIEVTNGEITVDMAQGDTDGLDVNGNLYISGGTLNINCQSPFDYDGEGVYSGGTLIVNGEQTTELTNQMMGGGMGGGPGGGMGGMQGGDMGGGMQGGFGGW